jgi:hypothetical protein
MMDVLIVGVPRSGTSMLSNLMSSPPETLVLYEPHLGMRQPSDHVNAQLSELGWGRFDSTRQLVKHVSGSVERWGAKEVMPRHIRQTLQTCGFKLIIFMVRNLEHAALSLIDRVIEMPHVASPDRWGRAFVETSTILVDLFNRCDTESRVVVRYEKFVADQALRRSLEKQLKWPLIGDLEVGFKRQGRWLEIKRHERQVTATSLKLRSSEGDPGKLDYAAKLVSQCAEYQRLFGYTSSPEL